MTVESGNRACTKEEREVQKLLRSILEAYGFSFHNDWLTCMKEDTTRHIFDLKRHGHELHLEYFTLKDSPHYWVVEGEFQALSPEAAMEFAKEIEQIDITPRWEEWWRAGIEKRRPCKVIEFHDGIHAHFICKAEEANYLVVDDIIRELAKIASKVSEKY